MAAVALAVICVVFFACRRWVRFYILFELSLLPTLAMVLLYGYQPEKLSAGGYLLLYTALASLPLLLLLVGMPSYFSAWEVGLIGPGAGWIAATMAFIVKTPLYGVHLWLPKAHVEAPAVGRMALAGILLKLGSYGLWLMVPVGGGFLSVAFLILRVWGSLVCGVLCLRQWDIKSLIAYSSVVHIGVVRVGLLIGREVGRGAALIIVVAHGVRSPVLFRFAYHVYRYSHSRLLTRCRGGWASPLRSALFLLMIAVNIGVPPFLNL